MNSYIKTLRSVGAEFCRRLWIPITIITAVVSLLLLGGVFYLQFAISKWFILLAIPMIIVVSVAGGLLFMAYQIIKTVSAAKTRPQIKATKAFVDKLQAVSDAISTPKFLIFFYVLRDVVSPKKGGYIDSLATNTTSLRKDLKKLTELF